MNEKEDQKGTASAMREIQDLLIDNFRYGLRASQRYFYTSLGGSLVALFLAWTGGGANVNVPGLGVAVPSSIGFLLASSVFWLAGIMSAYTLYRVDQMLDDLKSTPTLVAAAIQLPVFITAPSPYWRFLPAVAPPLLYICAIFLKEGMPEGLGEWVLMPVAALYACFPFLFAIRSIRDFRKHSPVIGRDHQELLNRRIKERWDQVQELRQRNGRVQPDSVLGDTSDPP